MRMLRYCATLCVLLTLVLLSRTTPTSGAPFDFDTGNAAIEVVIPAAIPAILGTVSPGANDASLVLRITAIITTAWFDAIAPYHGTAVGVYSRLGRRPAAESATNRNKNVALIYASYRVMNSLLPQHAADWRNMMTSVGLDPDDAHTGGADAIGIGNAAGNAVAAVRERDGMNQLGDEGGRLFNRRPYSDYLGYEPVNTAYQLHDPSRWQPNIVSRGNGLFQVQQFVTPQWRVTQPYSYRNPDQFRADPPVNSNPHHPGYRQQADQVLAASAALTDEQKAMAELFDNKLRSLGFSALFVAQSRGFTLDQFVHYDFLVNVAAFDGGIAAWNEKFRYDAVRPLTAIRYLYGDRRVTAWGGPGQGTVRVRASEWRSYLNTADHPEYPSGSACFCAAHAQASRRFLGSDAFGYSVPVPRGSSSIESGITPANDIVLGPWNTFTEFEEDCAMSRFWGGVHFLASLDAGQQVCRPIGDTAYEFLKQHVDGRAR
jgi:hypothetical protein